MTGSTWQADIEAEGPLDAEQPQDSDLLTDDEDTDYSHAETLSVGISNDLDDASAAELAGLMSRVMHHDEQALASLFEQLSARVFSVALQITRNVGHAEEVLQDVFWQLWRQAPRFDATRGSVCAWVLTIARSRALDAYRRVKRDLPLNAGLASDDVESSVPCPDPGPQDFLIAAEQISHLQRALQALDPERRQLISLSFYSGLSHQEISDLTGLPLGTVKTHLRRSIATLRKALGNGQRYCGTTFAIN